MPPKSTGPHEVKLHDRFQVKCNGGQIAILGIYYEHDAKSYLPLLEPARGARNQILKRQPTIESKSSEWWKAQCIFRGLDFSGSDSKVFQARLRAAPDTEMTADIQALKTKMTREYWDQLRKAEKEAEEERKRSFNARWLAMSYDEKARTDGRLMISQGFPPSEKKSNPIIFRFQGDHKEAESLFREYGLKFEIEAFPDGHPDKSEMYNFIAIIARSVSDINKSKEWLKVKKSIQRAQVERQKKLTGTGKEWNVIGKYRIQCSDIDLEAEYFEIFAVNNQLCAKFKFGNFSGVFRFEKQPEKDTKKTPAVNEAQAGDMERKRKYDSDSDEDKFSEVQKQWEDSGNEEERDNEEEEEGYEDEFQLGEISLPSDKYRSWTFRWRGEECGDGQISQYPIFLGTDSQSYELKFCEPRGMKIEGTLGGGFLSDKYTFTGEKIGGSTGGKINPSFEWFKRSKWAYHNTGGRRGRW